jgi:LCP family protein required for cell wall assembly
MSYHGKHRLSGSRRPLLRAIAISTSLVLLVLAGAVYFTYRHLEGNITVSDAFETITEPRPPEVQVQVEGRPAKPLNILIMGSDSRRGQTAVAGNAPGLSDTTILLHLSADRQRAYGVSIPRDLMVARPACRAKDGRSTLAAAPVAMWNEAFALGGEACTIAQFEKMTNLRVNHFVVIDFNGFKAMVEALGGVPVCVPNEVDDAAHGIYLPAGRYEVTGDQALDYVRVRHDIGTTETGDIGRMKRQQAFMAAMVNKAISAGTLLNPSRLVNFLNAATESLETDPGLAKISTLAGLAQDVRDIGLDKVQFFSLPFESYQPDPNRLAPAPGARAMWRQLRRDAVLDKRFTSGAAKASQGAPKKGGKKPKPAQSAEAAVNGLCA